MLLVAGLGNPGKKYINNRHNIGFMMLDYLVGKNNLNEFKKKKNFYYSLNSMDDNDVVLLKPTTYMNLSGLAITSAMAFFKIKVKDVVVIFDDVALPFGKIRVRENGSHGGHNGLKNIQAQLGTQDYKRIRVGIGAPEFEGGMISHVLGNFEQKDLDVLNEQLFPNVEESLRLIFKNQIKEAMNKFNGINVSES